MKFQSAMEYLMTYGWAILIIAVVLIGLNYLGIFNSETFAPKASPGACYVLRTAAQVSLAGECNNYIPRSVGYFAGSSSSYVALPSAAEPTGAFTVSLWIDPLNNFEGPWYPFFGGNGNAGANDGVWSGLDGGSPVCFYSYIANSITQGVTTTCSTKVSVGSWTFISLTWTGSSTSTLTEYVNTQPVASSVVSITDPLTWSATNFYIGKDPTGQSFPGYIANFQVYNTSLSQSDLQTLYAEGIGGVPINIQHLTAWYPLNGDTNDYSGNGNNGANNNVVFKQNWYTSYTPT